MELSEILSLAGSHRRRRRVGRGPGSGHGKTCGRGHKGSCSRAGATRFNCREGGQMPLFRRLPKRGFSNFKFQARFNIVNVGDLDSAFEDGAHVTPDALLEAGLVRSGRYQVKILGDGTLRKKLKVEASKFSKTGAEKIKAAGGEIVVI